MERKKKYCLVKKWRKFNALTFLKLNNIEVFNATGTSIKKDRIKRSVIFR